MHLNGQRQAAPPEVRPLRAAAAHQAIERDERKSTVRNSSEFVDAAQL